MAVYTLTVEWGGAVTDRTPTVMITEAPDMLAPLATFTEILVNHYGPESELYELEPDPGAWAAPGVLFHGDLSERLALEYEVIYARPSTEPGH
ncbi:hypothetical protein [Actinomadura rudentiformis]|uniref:Uncharacterized protein n=1 Tax=Actinomadura rudentiformis TaxID=359158 RepID=A0A6H9YKG5_9ACTN|nr:hypothetical protein [Actinomadura rudentiformis]KAB2344913.1 hypothetical protein F8566_30455 [Actinomadura rudentiformis]